MAKDQGKAMLVLEKLTSVGTTTPMETQGRKTKCYGRTTRRIAEYAQVKFKSKEMYNLVKYGEEAEYKEPVEPD